MRELSGVALDPLDIATGMAFGLVADPPPLPDAAPSVTDALEDVLARMLARPPCLVAFSGGRDSSAALAIATRVARRHGLDPPIPITYRLPRHPAATEDDYQDTVIAHLRLGDWIRIEVDDELDCVGDWARDAVARIGLRWPFNTFFMLPLARHAAGGSLVTGFGGDELLAPGTHDRALALLTGRARPHRADARVLRRALAPRARRERTAAREASPPDWLTPVGEAEYRRRAGELRGRARLSYERELVDDTWPSRYVQQARASLAAVGEAAGAEVCGLFAEPEAIATLARRYGRRGPRSRAAVLSEACADTLPASFFERTTKAEFNTGFWGPRAQAFAAAADPERLEVDRELVDPARLVERWRRPDPDARSFLLAQACAFAGERVTPGR
jgi:asparagine synthase (glutamine-hydrolysing)